MHFDLKHTPTALQFACNWPNDIALAHAPPAAATTAAIGTAEHPSNNMLQCW